MPCVVLGASYIGFGSLVRQSGLDLWHGVFSSFSAWALPGQIALVELYSVGASLAAIAVAVALSNMRLLPMAAALMPLLQTPGRARWPVYFAAHFVAVTAWAGGMQRCPDLDRDRRLPWFFGYAAVLWMTATLCTAAGFLLADTLPGPVGLGLVFLNPIYFMLIFVADFRIPARAWALGLGAVGGPLIHLAEPRWGLVITGFVAGTAAFALRRWSVRRPAKRDG